MTFVSRLVIIVAIVISCFRVADAASVKPGDQITPDSAAAVADLVSPGNLYLVRQGMRMKIVPTDHIAYPSPYKNATEKYSPQVGLGNDGELRNYVAGLPFPLLDSNDPQAALKVMWNFAFRPQYTDDVDIHDVEGVSYQSAGGMRGPVIHFEVGHFAYYNNVGRTEIQPIPTDPDASGGGILYRFGAFSLLEPEDIRESGLVRWRYKDPNKDDTVFFFVPHAGGVHVRKDVLSDALGPVTIDPDSFFGFSPKIEDYTYKLLGVRPMLGGRSCSECSRATLSVRQRAHRVSRELGDTPAIHCRSECEAAYVASEDRQLRGRNPETDSLYRFRRMVHNCVRSVRPQWKTMEDAGDLQRIPRSPGSGCEGCHLSFPADVSDRHG